jgi:hypothetical protein
MDKNFLREVFNPWGGFVYSWQGTVPDGQDHIHWITEQFITAVGHHDVNTTVVDLGDRGGWVLYVNVAVDINSSDFALEHDLTPEPFDPPENGEDSTQINPPPHGGAQ